jgi:hypothetical protein
MIRQSCLLASALCFALVACDDDDETTSPTTGFAAVRFINATNTNISVANNGAIATGNTSLAFGDRSTCVDVNVNASAGAGLRFTNVTTGTVLSTFTPSFTAGGNYTVVAYTAANGATQFAILNNAFTPSSGQAGVRFFNAAANAGTLTLQGNGTAFTGNSAIALGSAGTFVSVPAGSQTVTFNNGTTNVLNAGSLNFTAGQNSTIVIGPPTTGATGYRFFTATGC